MIALLHPRRLVLALMAVTALATSAPGQDTSASPVMTLIVDETQSARRIAFVHEEIRVRPGTLAMAYPRWIPGEHGPTGPIFRHCQTLHLLVSQSEARPFDGLEHEDSPYNAIGDAGLSASRQRTVWRPPAGV